jgi:hypothetical protein
MAAGLDKEVESVPVMVVTAVGLARVVESVVGMSAAMMVEAASGMGRDTKPEWALRMTRAVAMTGQIRTMEVPVAKKLGARTYFLIIQTVIPAKTRMTKWHLSKVSAGAEHMLLQSRKE